MTRAALTSMYPSGLGSLLSSTVSHSAQETRLAPLFIGFRLEVDYVATREDLFLGTVLQGGPAMSFLARVKMWLTFLFTGRLDVEVAPSPQKLLRHVPSNRQARRRDKLVPNAARPAYGLRHAILKHWGYKRFVQWLYNRTLMSRVRWCWRMFTRRVRARLSLGCMVKAMAIAFCAAPLRPD